MRESLLPTAAAVQKLVTDLVGCPVVVTPRPEVAVTPGVPNCVAEFIDDTGEVTIVAVSDLTLACHVGAALPMIEPEIAEGWVEKGAIDENIADNYREVVNVLSAVFNEGKLHFKLLEQHVTPGVLPQRVVLALLRAKERMDLQVTIPDFGVGGMSIVVGR